MVNYLLTIILIILYMSIQKNIMYNTEKQIKKTKELPLNAKILLIEDDAFSAQMVLESLKKEGIVVDICTSGSQALKLIDKRYNLVVLDMQLPDMSGMDILNNLPVNDCPSIVVWSGSCTVSEQIAAWQTGHILDFVEKPINVHLLIERLKNRLYISNNILFKNYQIKIGAIKFDLKKKNVQIYENILHLSQKEYSLLSYLVQNCDCVIEKSIVMDALYYKALQAPDNKILDVIVCKLRSKIEEFDPFRIYIETQWARGYVIHVIPKLYLFAQMLAFVTKGICILFNEYSKIYNILDENNMHVAISFDSIKKFTE